MSKTYLKICAVCGKEFESKSPNAKYCSDTCRNKAAAERRKKKREDEKNQAINKEQEINISDIDKDTILKEVSGAESKNNALKDSDVSEYENMITEDDIREKNKKNIEDIEPDTVSEYADIILEDSGDKNIVQNIDDDAETSEYDEIVIENEKNNTTIDTDTEVSEYDEIIDTINNDYPEKIIGDKNIETIIINKDTEKESINKYEEEIINDDTDNVIDEETADIVKRLEETLNKRIDEEELKEQINNERTSKDNQILHADKNNLTDLSLSILKDRFEKAINKNLKQSKKDIGPKVISHNRDTQGKENNKIRYANISEINLRRGEIRKMKVNMVPKEELSGFRKAKDSEYKYIKKKIIDEANDKITVGIIFVVIIAIVEAILIATNTYVAGITALVVILSIILFILACIESFVIWDGVQLKEKADKNIFHIMECNVFSVLSGAFDDRVGVLIKNNNEEYCKDVFFINKDIAESARKNPDRKFLLVKYYYDGKISRTLIPVKVKEAKI